MTFAKWGLGKGKEVVFFLIMPFYLPEFLNKSIYIYIIYDTYVYDFNF